MLRVPFPTLLALTASLPALAFQPTWLRCQGCVAGPIAQEMAASLLAGQRLVVYDRHAGWAQGFEIVQQVVGGPDCHERAGKEAARSNCQLVHVAQPGPLGADEQQLAQLFAVVHQQTAGTMKLEVSLPSSFATNEPGPVTLDPAGSALDVANNHAYAARLREATGQAMSNQAWVEQHAASLANGAALLRAVVGITVLGEALEIKITLTFPDGSQVRLEKSYSDSQYRITEMVDALGRPALQQENSGGLGFAGGVDFPSMRAAENWIETARRLGIPITDGRDLPPNRVVCTWDGETLHCYTNAF